LGDGYKKGYREGGVVLIVLVIGAPAPVGESHRKRRGGFGVRGHKKKRTEVNSSS